MADMKSDQITMPDVGSSSTIRSTKSLVFKDSKKKFSIGEFSMIVWFILWNKQS
jgi:hypothetical protein